MNKLLIFFHVAGAAIILGGEFYLQLIVYPVLSKDKTKIDKNSPLIKIYDKTIPLTLGALLVIAITGIMIIFNKYTYFKDAPQDMLILLGIKFILLTLLIFISIYQTFSLRSKMAGLHPLTANLPDTAQLAKTSRSISIIIVLIIAAALFCGTMV